jgi:hypothetical protein
MKFQVLFFIASLGAITICSNCKSDPAASGKPMDESANTAATTDPTTTSTTALPANAPAATVPTDPQTNVTAVPNPTVVPDATANTVKKPEPAQNAKGIWHYTCPKGCAGGAGAEQPCAKCSTKLVHNKAYHENTAPAAKTNAVLDAASQPKPEPAQNTKGVWHYTCLDGCAGGAGSAVPCAKCGKTLSHNAAYHQ